MKKIYGAASIAALSSMVAIGTGAAKITVNTVECPGFSSIVVTTGSSGDVEITAQGADLASCLNPGTPNPDTPNQNDFDPVITNSSSITYQENSGNTITLNASDQDADTTGTFVFTKAGGADQAAFEINGNVLSFVAGSEPDYESPADTGNDRTYELTVQVSDADSTGSARTATKTFNITISNDPSDDPTGGGGSCPAVTAPDRVVDIGSWSNQSQLSGKHALANETVSFKFTATNNSAFFGYVEYAAATGVSDVATGMWFSECPGSQPPLAQNCSAGGFADGALWWSQGSTYCQLTPGQTYYLNVKNYPQEASRCNGGCGFHLAARNNGTP